MRLIHKLIYFYHLILNRRSSEFMDLLIFLHRIDDLNIDYLGGPEKLLQISGRINDYHWSLMLKKYNNRFFNLMRVIYPTDKTHGLTERHICIHLTSEVFNGKEIDIFKRLVYSLPKSSTNIIAADDFNLNVAEAVSRHLYRIDGKMCTYTFK